MSSIRSFAAPQMEAFSHDVRRRADGQAVALAMVLLLGVLIVEAVAIVNAVQSVPEIAWLYTSTT
jgi:hypothetical protein